MAKTTTVYLENVRKNDYMCWHICSQCLNTGKIVLRDDSTVYLMVEKNTKSTSIQHLSQGADTYRGGANLRFEITVDTTAELRTSNAGDAILDSSGRNVGFIYNYCVEDSTDNDFNDFYLNIAAWRNKG
ncbi:hypothetical protein ABDB91_01560 [Desulfoscipio sp. XC116]|uniref:hypothetical protein n=1 Tax=Desulfoscipio sp. XC116 TaxID=3144975 RepID=UPI00325C24C7